MKAIDYPSLFNVEAERAVLGSMLLDRAAIAVASGLLTREDFFRDSHREYFSAMVSLFHRGIDVDLVTLPPALPGATADEETRRLVELSELLFLPSALHVEHYARIVADSAARRRMIAAAEGVAASILRDPTVETSTMMASAVDAILKAAPVAPPTIHRLGDGETLGALMDNLDAAERGEEIGLPLALPDLQRLVGGLRDGHTTMIAGRPGMGKSSLAVWEVLHALRKGKRVLMYSLEMPVEEVYARLAAALDGRTSYRSILGVGRPSRAEADAARAAIERLYTALKGELWVDDAAGLTAEEIRARVLMHIARHGRPDLVVIDHVHEIAIPGRNAHEEIGGAAKLLRRVAKDERFPLILVAQLSRDLERRADKRPTLSDLRASGTLEEIANVILFLYRDEYYNPDSATPGVAEIAVSKNRQGATGIVEARYDAPTGLWSSLSSFPDPIEPPYATNGRPPAHDFEEVIF